MIGNVVIFGVDPGVQTGVAMGFFELDDFGLPSIADIVRKAGVKTYTTEARRGPENEMWTALEIMERMHDYLQDAELLAGPVEGEYWLEDFVLTRLGSSNRDGLAPVRVTAHIEWVAAGDDLKVVKVLPAASKRIVSDIRLREWGGWKKGRDHERDAFRQLIMGVRQHRADYLRKPA